MVCIVEKACDALSISRPYSGEIEFKYGNAVKRCALAIADKIEREQQELADRLAVNIRNGEVQELGVAFAAYADCGLHKPMLEGEDIKEWLSRNYIALPCDKDGKPWVLVDAVPQRAGSLGIGTVRGYWVDSCGVGLLDFDGDNKPVVHLPSEVKRPEPPVLDADGVEIHEEETVYGIGRKQHCYTVQKVPDINEEYGPRFSVRCYDHNDGDVVWCDPSALTHREPDSYKKLRDDMKDFCDQFGRNLDDDWQYAILANFPDRLTAIMERGQA